MEEDISKAEALIKKCDECKLNECINCEISWTEIAAIRRIINRYRELEEREIWSTATIEGLKKDFIPKSKIKEKIELYEKMIYEIRKENRVKQNATKYDYLIVGKRDGLKELLEEE